MARTVVPGTPALEASWIVPEMRPVLICAKTPEAVRSAAARIVLRYFDVIAESQLLTAIFELAGIQPSHHIFTILLAAFSCVNPKHCLASLLFLLLML